MFKTKKCHLHAFYILIIFNFHFFSFYRPQIVWQLLTSCFQILQVLISTTINKILILCKSVAYSIFSVLFGGKNEDVSKISFCNGCEIDYLCQLQQINYKHLIYSKSVICKFSAHCSLCLYFLVKWSCLIKLLIQCW